MGFFTHIFEAEFFFAQGTSLEDLRAAVLAGIESLQSQGWEVVEDRAPLFQRPGDKHNYIHAYRNKEEKNVELTVFGTHTSKIMGFVDDLAFTFGETEVDTPYIKALSVSRVGEGDLYQNKRNIINVMDQVKRVHPFSEKPKVYRS